MVIKSSEVSMASRSSLTSYTRVEQKQSFKPCIRFGQNGCLTQADDAEEVQETSGAPTVASDNYLVRMKTMSYLLRMLLFNHMNGKNDPISQILQDAFKNSGNVQVTTVSNYEHYECQSTSFDAQGKVITGDGRELDFSYSFSMSDEFYEAYSEEMSYVQTMAYIDPLVINLDSNPAKISDQKFYFDLDADGNEEEISRLGAGSGFLAIDLNNDGIINDGSELFGTKSGDGFADLAKYDEDGNGWIDENDSIYEKLRVWTMDEKGHSELYTLKQSDVGAICLRKCETPFTNYGRDNVANSVIRSSGIYLKESTGRAAGIQHVDFAR